MARLVIVGAGLFGSIAAELAQRAGHSVTLLDAGRPMAASPAAGCVLKPSWLGSIPSEDAERGVALLKDLYGLQELHMRTNVPLVHVRAQAVSPTKILRPALRRTVVGVQSGAVFAEDPETSKVERFRGTVLVAAGIWSRELVLRMPPMRGLVGASLRFRSRLEEPRLSVWAPYRQAVAYQEDRATTWFGDGTAIVESRWNEEERVAATLERARAFGLTGKPVVRVGIRPYVEGYKGGYLHQLEPKLWVSTGGAKNGVVLAAVQALKLVEAL